MTESAAKPPSQPSEPEVSERAYEQGVERPYDRAYDVDARTTEPVSPSGISSSAVSEIVDQLMAGTPPEAVRTSGIQAVLDQFQALSVDEKLATFYYLYEAMGETVTPADLGAASTELAQSFFAEFDALPEGESQLEAQRAIAQSDDTALSREYGKQTENNKLAIWYLIAVRMGRDVIGMPADYRLSNDAQSCLEAVKQLGFEQQITFLREIARCMGRDPITT
ncbi:orange carotenoid protein N-terminal domain-containing protein [Anthocerotibacter panamensis]|uniref:orange carotenoid protein N-terminal domain-containing protein n=1 Tax=Anthocerotibacter panamensis TaxID=2857077 RepID=UPI001C404C96|nr:orange carotenoid protein N-terminal domain-containing protein [Anthocerotibacter panamensis]